MTLVVERGTHGARTHALVIGVGAYPHLIGGGQQGKVVKDVPLSQLSSPPVSARAFADWLAAKHDCPEAELGTVELLLSPAGLYKLPSDAPEVGSVKEIEVATWSNVHAAARRWWSRCDSDPGNIALFYFCGHGLELEVGNQALLLSDFGADDLDQLVNAINLYGTNLVMDACTARHQVFIIDACREVVRPLKDYPPGVGRPLFNVKIPRQSMRTAAILYSTSRGDRAYGDRDQISRYTSALLDGLNGAGADELVETEEWVITLDALSEALGVLLEDENQVPTFDGPRRPNPPALHRLSGPPQVKLELACRPEDELAYTILALHAQPPAVDQWIRRPPVSMPWEVDVPAGPYRLEANCDAGRWTPPRPRRIAAKPPRRIRVSVEVEL